MRLESSSVNTENVMKKFATFSEVYNVSWNIGFYWHTPYNTKRWRQKLSVISVSTLSISMSTRNSARLLMPVHYKVHLLLKYTFHSDPTGHSSQKQWN